MSDYTKHTVTTDALDTLGTIIGPDEKRDAIHLAVDPVPAGHRLAPGTHVALRDGVAVGTTTGEGVGIVDPFLTAPVEEGERFWLVVYPRQISSLRHVWEHPAFPPSGETGVTEAEPVTKETAEAWLRNFCDTHDCPTFEMTIAKAIEGGAAWDDDYLHFDGYDAHGPIPDEFWRQLSIYTGRDFDPDDNPSHFSCGC